MKGKIPLVVFVILVIWTGIGAIVLSSQNQNIQGNTGQVWVEIERGDGLLKQLEGQLKFTTAAQQQAIHEITTARNNILAAQKVGDLQKATAAANNVQVTLENYPDFGLSQVQEGVLEETAGSFNRVAYAQYLLIQAQTSYNGWRIVFFPDMLFFHHIGVLGSGSNPNQQLNPPGLNES